MIATFPWQYFVIELSMSIIAQEEIMAEQIFHEPKQNIFYIFDDGHGDYNRSYEQYERDIDYADYSTDHRDNNYRNYEKKVPKTKKERIQNILNHYE